MIKNILAFVVSILIIGSAIFYVSIDEVNDNEDFAKSNEEEVINNNYDEIMDYEIILKTNRGEIKFKSFSDLAPNTVDNFVSLSEDGFYDGLTFHRVIDGFMIQGGCPEGTGRGGPGYTFDDEIDLEADVYQGGYDKGIVAMANSGPNTNGSQFFIMVEDYPLPPQYTIFGEVTEGQKVVDEIAKMETNQMDKPLEDVVIEEVLIQSKES